VERRLVLMTKLGAVTAVLAILATRAYLYQHKQTGEVKRLAKAESLQRQRAEESLSQLEMRGAEELLASGNSAAGVAHLARIVRENPGHRVAAQRLMAVLSQRRFPRPALAPLKHEGNVVAVEFSPDGQRVVTASWDKSARVWDVRTGQPLTDPLKHNEPLVSAGFSPDGLKVVTTCLDLTVRVWDARTGEPLTERLKIRDEPFAGGTIAALQKPPYAKRFLMAQSGAFAQSLRMETGC